MAISSEWAGLPVSLTLPYLRVSKLCFMRPGVIWWWLLLKKPHSCICSQFDSKQCSEQFVTPLPCFSQSRCNSLAFRTPVLLHLLLELDTSGGVDPLGVFPLFQKMVADIIAPKLSIMFHGHIRQGRFRIVGSPRM